MNADDVMFSRDPEGSVLAVNGRCAATVMTAQSPGAIAIVQLVGDVVPVLRAVTGVCEWPIGRLRLADLGGLDEGLVVRLKDDVAQVMPHGGPRVVQRMMALLAKVGAEIVSPREADPVQMYPEAEDEVEARMLAVMARAASPLAVDLLLAQPLKWRGRCGTPLSDRERERSVRLNRLLHPPLVVLAGPPNVGKSTLSNALLGRSMSIAVDMPGTTRDYTAGLIDLGGLVVQWHDTPGIRESDDPIEQRAIELSKRLLERADFIVSMIDAEHDWLTAPELPREDDMRVANKADLGTRADADLDISAVTGDGLADLVRTVRDALVPPEDIAAARESRWVFDPKLGD